MSDGPLGLMSNFLSKIFGKSGNSRIRPGRTIKPKAGPEKRAAIARPTGFYVYAHKDQQGQIFYVGKGKGRRAWSTDRHDVWHRYVNERLGGVYSVEICSDRLTEAQAINLESALIDKYGSQLINWDNPGRDFDYQAIARYHKLRNANRQFIAETRPLESSDSEQAVDRYRRALLLMCEYESIVMEHGLVAELTTEIKNGDLNILDRLTLCLQQLGRFHEMTDEVERYFAKFPAARDRAVGKRIQARVEKARLMQNERRT